MPTGAQRDHTFVSATFSVSLMCVPSRALQDILGFFKQQSPMELSRLQAQAAARTDKLTRMAQLQLKVCMFWWWWLGASALGVMVGLCVARGVGVWTGWVVAATRLLMLLLPPSCAPCTLCPPPPSPPLVLCRP